MPSTTRVAGRSGSKSTFLVPRIIRLITFMGLSFHALLPSDRLAKSTHFSSTICFVDQHLLKKQVCGYVLHMPRRLQRLFDSLTSAAQHAAFDLSVADTTLRLLHYRYRCSDTDNLRAVLSGSRKQWINRTASHSALRSDLEEE